MTKRDLVAKLLRREYITCIPNAQFVQIVAFANDACPWSDDFLVNLRWKSKKKKFSIKDIIPQTCDDLPHYCSNFSIKTRGKKSTPVFAEKTGLYKIEFTDGSIMFFAKWFSGAGKATLLESMFAADKPTWNRWLKLFQEEKKKGAKPKIGVYRVSQYQGIISYEEVKKIPNNKIFHAELDKIRDSVNYYFNNVTSFMKYNQPGRRSLLLYGEQGTSKTSTLYQLALEHGHNKSVAFSTDISAIAMHIRACEKYSIPTLAFFEDAEGAFKDNNADVKNFLSGIDARQNKAGTCIVYTTNYPERIEETIIERPERIDELHYIGPIDGELLYDCVKFYFAEHYPKTMDLSKVLKYPMTGAEVKLMVENTLRYCASEQKDLDADAIDMVLNRYKKDLKKLREFADNQHRTLARRSQQKDRPGFTVPEESKPRSGFLLPSNGEEDDNI